MMKKLITITLILMAFCSCEKESEELLIGGWDDLHSDVAISFSEDGRYSWGISNPGIDPNSGTGIYELISDTLKIEENFSWFDTTLVTYYNFSVNRNELELINFETQDVRNYERIKRFHLF